ncbi:MAG: cryptochrome/photolyase family protein [Haloplanus sp.]
MLIQPRQRRDTSRPVSPRVVYSIPAGDRGVIKSYGAPAHTVFAVPDPTGRIIVWLLGDQLHPEHRILEGADRVLLIEADDFADRRPSHPQKLDPTMGADARPFNASIGAFWTDTRRRFGGRDGWG